MDIIAASLAGALVIAAAIILALRKTGSRGAGGQAPGSKGGGNARRRGDARNAGNVGHARHADHAGKSISAAPRGIQPHCCPLCSSPLASGERVKSDLSTGKGDRIMRIFGCPACWPSSEGRPPRLCPVCGDEIPQDGYAVARYFESPGRKHVHVLGCSRCRPGA